MGRWLKALGLSGDGTPESGRVSNDRRAARIRETMRWRGFDLTAYSDEEIATAAELLGPSITPEGETTDQSRQALADLLLQLRMDPEAKPPSIPAPDEDIPEPAAAASSAEPEPTAMEDEPVSAAVPSVPVSRPRRPGERPTALERLKHIFGIHTWHLVDAADGDGQVLRCYGCHAERPLAAVATPLRFPDIDDSTESAEGPARESASHAGRVSRPEFGETPADQPASQQERPGEPSAGQAFRLLVRSPWWVKLVAFFVIIQVAGLVVRLLAGAG